MANIILLAVCLLAGIGLKKTGRFPAATPTVLNSFIIHISLPALAILHIHSMKMDSSLALTAAMAWLLFGCAWALFSCGGRLFRVDRETVGALIVVAGLGNTSFVGLPMIEAYFGKEYLGVGLIADQLGSFMVLSTLGIFVAAYYSSGSVSPRQMARKVLMFPPFQALVLVSLALTGPLAYGCARRFGADTAGALDLLRRLTLAVGQPFENLEPAASLLARNGRHTQAAEFYAQLVKAQPWNTAARVRLAQEQLAGSKDADAARAMAAGVARDSLATYDDRLAAAALTGAGASLGSGELDLLARSTVPPETADRPNFSAARVKAASGAAPEVAARLLQNALEDSPRHDAGRAALFYALVKLGRDQLALAAVGPLENAYLYGSYGMYYSERETGTPPENESETPADAATADEEAPQQSDSSQAAQRALNLAMGKACGRLENYQAALHYFQMAGGEKGDTNRFVNGWFEAQAMTREQALRAYTLWGATAAFQEKIKGSVPFVFIAFIQCSDIGAGLFDQLPFAR